MEGKKGGPSCYERSQEDLILQNHHRGAPQRGPKLASTSGIPLAQGTGKAAFLVCGFWHSGPAEQPGLHAPHARVIDFSHRACCHLSLFSWAQCYCLYVLHQPYHRQD